MRRYTLLLIALISALALAACGATVPTAEEIVERMEAAREATTSAHAVVAVDFTSPERSGRIVVEGWTEKVTDEAGNTVATRMRAEVLEASEGDLAGTVAVSDGTTFWIYSPAENTVITGEAGMMKQAAAATPAGAATMLTDLVAEGLDAVEVEVVGNQEEMLDLAPLQDPAGDRGAWKVRVTPKAETSAQLQLDGIIEGFMWVDTDLSLPLRLELDASDLGSGTVAVQSLETNQAIDPGTFTFTPPAGAEVVQAAELAAQMGQPTAATLDEARTAVSFTLREPAYLPAGMALVEVRVVGTSTVILNYAGEAGSVSVVQSNEDVGRDREPPAGSEVAEVTVGGLPATLITGGDGQGSLLRWEDAGVRYVVAGTLAGDEALRVAEGLE